MKTRAAIAVAPNKPLEIHEVDLDGPRAGEVLVEVMATGICHTDAYTLEGKDSEGIFPSILGHEGAGIVREVGLRGALWLMKKTFSYTVPLMFYTTDGPESLPRPPRPRRIRARAAPLPPRRLDPRAPGRLHRCPCRMRLCRRGVPARRHVDRERLYARPKGGGTVLPPRLAGGARLCGSKARGFLHQPRDQRSRSPAFLPGAAGRRASPLQRSPRHVHPPLPLARPLPPRTRPGRLWRERRSRGAEALRPSRPGDQRSGAR